MQTILPDDWEPGMVLARSVESDAGQILATRGTALSERMIALFRRRRIESLRIEGGGGGAPAQERLAELAGRFSEHRDRPFMMSLHGLFVEALGGSSDTEGEENG